MSWHRENRRHAEAAIKGWKRRRKAKPQIIKKLRPKTKPPFLFPRSINYKDTFVNKVCTITSALALQYAPVIEAGRYIYNHKEQVMDAVDVVFSNDTIDSKLDGLAELVANNIKSNIASTCASTLTGIVFSTDVISELDDRLNINYGGYGEDVFKGFFRSSVEKLILNSGWF